MAHAEFNRLEKWGKENYGDQWKTAFCRDADLSDSVPALLKRRSRLGLQTTIKISKFTGIPLTELGYPELREVMHESR